MKFYGLHTTTREERMKLLETPGKEVLLDPQQLHRSTIANTAIIIEEDEPHRTYVHPVADFLELCQAVQDPDYNPLESKYYKYYQYKAQDVNTRVRNLRGLIEDIRENGIKEPVHVEVTGERIDGSYRSKIAMFLGILEIQAIVHAFRWQDISEDFIERKLEARWLSSRKDYYEFDYGYKDWKNIKSGGDVYQENAARWETIVPLIDGETVLDIGCNEGYIGIQAARAGKKVIGIDTEWTHIAYLNKLIFEFVDKKDLDIEFHEENLMDTKHKADTILMLNVLYHIPRAKQSLLLQKFKGKQIIFQCNLRKEAEREKYYTSHPDDLKALLKELKMPHRMIEWKDKPIIIAG